MDLTERFVEQSLVFRSRTGDEAAFTKLVERYHGPLLYYVRRLLGREEGAQDVLQDVWLSAYRTLPRLKDPRTFRTWLYHVARNRAIDLLRQKRQLVPLDELDEAPTDESEADDFAAEDAARVHSALGRLSQAHREALTLRFVEQMSYDEIASVVGCDPGTVRSRLHHAKRMLRRQLEALP